MSRRSFWIAYPRFSSGLVFCGAALVVSVPITFIFPIASVMSAGLVAWIAAMSAFIAGTVFGKRFSHTDNIKPNPALSDGMQVMITAQLIFTALATTLLVFIYRDSARSTDLIADSVMVFFSLLIAGVFVCWLTLPIGSLAGLLLHGLRLRASRPPIKVLGCGTTHAITASAPHKVSLVELGRRGGPLCPPAPNAEVPDHE